MHSDIVCVFSRLVLLNLVIILSILYSSVALKFECLFWLDLPYHTVFQELEFDFDLSDKFQSTIARIVSNLFERS